MGCVQNVQVTMQVSMKILAAVGEEDGIARWLS
jgi:hypothetical protein